MDPQPPPPPAPAPRVAPPPPRQSGVVVPRSVSWDQRLAARLIWLVVRCVALTLRFRLHDPGGLFSGTPSTEPIIFAIWHNRSSLSMILYERHIRRHFPQRRMAGLASASKDGALVARVMELFQVHPIRGSTSRRGAQALLELTSCTERGMDLGLTPDGPRGPRYVVQDGIVAAARVSGLPLVPVSYRIAWKVQLKSWDRYQIPLPLSRVDVEVGEPLRVPREADAAEREKLRAELQARLLAITKD